jgi:diguanylate cyclase (GGDEF)-like protein/PAS domain S-box-containing protein
LLVASNVPNLDRAGKGPFMLDSSEQFDHRMILEALPLGVYVVNREGKIVLWNAGAEHVTGYLRQDVLGRLSEVELLEQSENGGKISEEVAESPSKSLRNGAAVALQLFLRSKSGHSIPVQLRSVPLRNDHGALLGAAKIFQPISASALGNRRQNKLAAYGCLDALTGALNHSLIQAHVKESLDLYALYPIPFCVMCFAIDDLGKLRDRYGQAGVDAALRVVSQTIENALRPADFLGRWLEEEFLAVLPECGENDAAKVGQRLSKMVQHAVVSWWGDTFHVGISIGATSAHDHDTVSALVSRAERALRESSAAGGNRVVVVSP